MNANDTFDDPEDPVHTTAERASAASRSTWVSVGVNLVLSVLHIVVGVLAWSVGTRRAGGRWQVAGGHRVVIFSGV